MATETFRGPDSSPKCAECPCAVGGVPQRPIRGAGSLKSLAIVGEGPSTEELHQGWPFVGPSGKLLQQVFNTAGIDRHSIWITNAILCARPQSDKALAEAIRCCQPRLQHELSLVNPSALLALGASATKALILPVQAIQSARGTIQESPLLPSVPCVTALHPAAILRGGGAGQVSAGKNKMNVDAQYVYLESDVTKAFSLAQNPSQPLWQDDIELITDNSNTSLAKLLQFVESNPLLFAIDLEWGKDGNITWLGIATEEKAYSIYWPHTDHIARAILKRLGESETSKLFHNLQADVPIWESQVGPLNGIFEDTMLMHHAAFPGAAHDLQNVAGQFLLIPPWKADRRNEEKEDKKAISKAAKEAGKVNRKAEHAANNAASAEAAAKRKAARIAKHEQNNAAAKILKLIEGGK